MHADRVILHDSAKVLLHVLWRRFLSNYPSSFCDSFLKIGRGDFPSANLGRTDVLQHSIHTENERPLHQRPYRQPFHLRTEAQRQVEEMLDAGVIAPSNSPWSSPMILVPKKNEKLRFCVDFRRLNDCTTKDAYPIPRIDDALDSLGGSRYFTTLDLASGYWQVGMAPEDRARQDRHFVQRRPL